MTVLLDSGIYISALQFSGTPKNAIVRAVLRDRMLICSQIEEEVVRTMKKKFRHDPQIVQGLLSFYTNEATRIFVPGELTGVCRDSKDDFVLECAALGQANVIVTGDKDLLSLGHYQDIRILTPRQYLDQR